MELSEYLFRLNPKEIEVLKLMAEGRRSKEISPVLGISPRTVEGRITNIIEKLDARSQAHAVAIGIRIGIIA